MDSDGFSCFLETVWVGARHNVDEAIVHYESAGVAKSYREVLNAKPVVGLRVISLTSFCARLRPSHA